MPHEGTIFIIDDDLFMNRMYERAFRLAGHKTEVAYDGTNALSKLEALAEPPAVILLDVMMPHMDGFQFFTTLRQNPRFTTVPVVVLTNSFHEHTSEKFLAAGAKLYLVKIEHQSKDVVKRVEALIHPMDVKKS